MDLQETVEAIRLDTPKVRIDGAVQASAPTQTAAPIFHVDNVDFYYGEKRALKNIKIGRASCRERV